MSHDAPRYNAEQARKLLQIGNDRRLAAIAKNLENTQFGNQYKEQRDQLIEGQHPFAILVCCSDSLPC